jgi:hypothetical protein
MPSVTEEHEEPVSSGKCRPGASHTGPSLAWKYDNALEDKQFVSLVLESSEVVVCLLSFGFPSTLGRQVTP